MKLSKQHTTVTPLSKLVALILFILLPFIGFYIGLTFCQTSHETPIVSDMAH